MHCEEAKVMFTHNVIHMRMWDEQKVLWNSPFRASSNVKGHFQSWNYDTCLLTSHRHTLDGEPINFKGTSFGPPELRLLKTGSCRILNYRLCNQIINMSMPVTVISLKFNILQAERNWQAVKMHLQHSLTLKRHLPILQICYFTTVNRLWQIVDRWRGA